MSKEAMSKLGVEEGIIKVIDGEMYYKSHYCYWLYTQLEEMQNKIDKAIEYINNSLNNPLCDEREALKYTLDILRGESNE